MNFNFQWSVAVFMILLFGLSGFLRASVASNSEPGITVTKVNTTSVKKYEKFEVWLDLQNVNIENPYDPDEIDVHAIFHSPSGKEIRINGFYDNYSDADQWKVRFSANETGKYTYRLFVANQGKTGSSGTASFKSVKSNHRGWIKQSEVNPRYFMHDDGSTYYAVGVYSPWRNNRERFETFSKYNANLFAIWDIGYGGFINGTGIIEEELGRYNQEKCGKIDSLLSILEKDDIKLKFAIWPHDLFSATVWATQWNKNPYSQLIDVEDVYSDPLVWEYQKKKYRYLIARYAHSRSWGIWELINEMNGTDGWVKGRHQEAYDWVEKAQKYFTENDPYQHPMTASFSGGFNEYREPLYDRIDIPNLHLYPRQGWALKYPEDSLRSSMYNYAWAARRFWDRYEKPSIFGEAGAEWSYFERSSENYRINYHNVIWVSLTNGLAGIPVWWDYTFLTEQDWEQLSYLRKFVDDIDFANLPYQPVEATATGADIYVMDASKEAFGWLRSFEKENVKGTDISISKSGKGNYTVSWYDTWSGREIKTEKVKSQGQTLKLTAPEMEIPRLDIAFKIRRR